MRKALLFSSFIVILVFCAATPLFAASDCVTCHEQVTPNIVKDFMSGKMGQSGLDCSVCHGKEHNSADNAGMANLPTQETCKACHGIQHDQYMEGKHAAGWVAMSAMPKTGFQPHAYIQGLKGCGGCHKVGVRDAATRADSQYGSPCDSCHTRHNFSK